MVCERSAVTLLDSREVTVIILLIRNGSGCLELFFKKSVVNVKKIIHS